MSSYNSGDVIIQALGVLSPRGTIDLADSFISLKIFESIFVPNVICEITVIDTLDAIGGLLIQGDEQIIVQFLTPGGSPVNYVFALDLLSLDAVLGAQKAKQYTFHGVCADTLRSKANYVQKAYNTDISSIVQDIHKTFLSSVNSLVTEATHGMQNIIIPNIKPFEAIDMVRKRATSSGNPSSTFLYFQDKNNQNFKTIEGMMNSGSVKTYIHSDALNVSMNINNFYNILDYDVPQIINAAQRIDLGALNQTVGTLDLRTRKYQTTQTQPSSGFNSSAFKSMFGATAGLFSFIPFDSLLRGSTNIPQTTPNQMSYVSDLMQRWINLKCYGDTNITVGQTITCNIPESISITGNIPLDPLISGNYLISRLCRQIGPIEDKPRYVDIIEGIAGSPAT